MKSRFFLCLAILSTVAAIAAGITFYRLQSLDVAATRVVFKGARGSLVGDVYRPILEKGVPGGYQPCVLICHGVENNKEVTAALATEFARRGFTALAFDYGGYGESEPHGDDMELMVEDTVAALNFLAKLPDVNPEYLAIVGHSMGTSYAVEAAMRSGRPVKAVVGLGNEVDATPSQPLNLLLAMGLYDAFHTLPDMLGSIRRLAGLAYLMPDQLVGDFNRGTARSLFVSPISDHGMEPLDPRIISQTINWVEKSIGKNGSKNIPIHIKETCRAEARIILIVAGILAITAFLVSIYTSFRGSRRFYSMLRFPLLMVAVAGIAGNVSSSAVALACADITLVVLVSDSIAAHLARSSKSAETKGDALREASRRFYFGAGFIGAVAVSLLAGLLIHGVPVAMQRPEWAKAIPAFLFHILFLRPYEGWCMIRAYAFSAYSQGWIPRIWFGGLILLEAVRPGAAVWVVGRAAQVIVRAFQLRGPYKLGASRRSWVALAAVLMALAAIFIQRLREGWISGEALRRMGAIAFKFMIVPLFIFILILNLPFFRRAVEVDAGNV